MILRHAGTLRFTGVALKKKKQKKNEFPQNIKIKN